MHEYKLLILFFFQRIIYFYFKGRCMERRTDIVRIFHLQVTPQMAITARAELIWSPEPGILSGLPHGCLSPRDLSNSLVLFQATSRGLNEKWSSRDVNWCPLGISVFTGGGLACCAPTIVIFSRAHLKIKTWFKITVPGTMIHTQI